MSWCSGCWRRRGRRPHQSRGGRGLRAERRRRTDDRVRRIRWALDGAAAPVAAVLRLEPAMRPAGALRSGDRPADGMPAREIRFATSPSLTRRGIPDAGAPVLEAFRSDDSRRFVARHRRPERRRQDDAREAAVPVVRSAAGAIEIDGVDLARVRSRVLALARDGRVPGFHPLRTAAARQRFSGGAPDDVVRAALEGGRGEPGRARHGAGPRL